MKRPTKFWTRKVGSVNIIDVTGRLAPEGTDDALFKIVTQLVDAGERKFLVDLSSTTFISSLGVGSLLRAARAVEAKDGELKLLSPSHSVARILELSRMNDVFAILGDENSAVASFDQPRAPRLEIEEEAPVGEEEPSVEAGVAAVEEAQPEEEKKPVRVKKAAADKDSGSVEDKKPAKPRKPRKKAEE